MTYKFIQFTNLTGGAVATGEIIPLGVETTSSVCGCANNTPTFVTSTGGVDAITVNACVQERERGGSYYTITYNISAVATAAGLITIGLLTNNTTTPVYTGSATATAAGDTVNITIRYTTKVLPNFLTGAGTSIRFINIGGGITSYVSNADIKNV